MNVVHALLVARPEVLAQVPYNEYDNVFVVCILGAIIGLCMSLLGQDKDRKEIGFLVLLTSIFVGVFTRL